MMYGRSTCLTSEMSQKWGLGAFHVNRDVLRIKTYKLKVCKLGYICITILYFPPTAYKVSLLTNLDYWVFGLCPLSSIFKMQCFGNWMLPSSGVGQGAPTLLGPLEIASLNHQVHMQNMICVILRWIYLTKHDLPKKYLTTSLISCMSVHITMYLTIFCQHHW
jgi:hypothetical protein